MFEPNKIYNRKIDIHQKYGGNQQSGIVNCPNFPYIFIFSSNSGKTFGYSDYWDNDYYYYTGMGSKGDMRFESGNKAILNHIQNEKKIFLFEGLKNGNCKYITELEFVDFNYITSLDIEGNSRNAIVFQLKKANVQTSLFKDPIIEYNNIAPTITERNGLITSRVGQGKYRLQVLEIWSNKCAVLGINNTSILIASHIKPWRKSSNEERVDPYNSILLTPNLDALFDRHLISFDNKGLILLSDKFSDDDYQKLGISRNMKLRFINDKIENYLKQHRQMII